MDPELFLKEWLKDKLSTVLKLQISDELSNHIFSIKSENEIETYLQTLFNDSNVNSRKFITEYLQRRRFMNSELAALNKFKSEKNKNQRENGKSDSKLCSNANAKSDPKVDVTQKKNASKKESNSKKKKKFVNLYDKGSKTPLLKGRYLCNCEAKKHKLINNCISCGRIVCEQEGSGPCFVCDNLVCTPEEQMIFNGDADKASELYEHLVMQGKPIGLEKAIEERNKLLEFDRNSEKHTHVFDDDSDYFCSSNPWLTLEEREKFKKIEEEFFTKKNESRRNKAINIRFDNDLKIIETTEKENKTASSENKSIDNSSEIICKNVQLKMPPVTIERLLDPYFADIDLTFKKTLKKNSQGNLSSFSDTTIYHLMDSELYKLKDEGFCLSIHQPWASFLVHGIRTVEGRTWYTSYRGTLWIASTGHRVTRETVSKFENTYRMIKGEIKFPADYPSNCLLGVVDLVNCLTQEQYREEFVNGEVEDPYVFIFENYQVLPIRYPIKGKPNIYKLDEKIHIAAKNCLKTVEKVLSESENKVKSFRP